MMSCEEESSLTASITALSRVISETTAANARAIKSVVDSQTQLTIAVARLEERVDLRAGQYGEVMGSVNEVHSLLSQHSAAIARLEAAGSTRLSSATLFVAVGSVVVALGAAVVAVFVKTGGGN